MVNSLLHTPDGSECGAKRKALALEHSSASQSVLQGKRQAPAPAERSRRWVRARCEDAPAWAQALHGHGLLCSPHILVRLLLEHVKPSAMTARTPLPGVLGGARGRPCPSAPAPPSGVLLCSFLCPCLHFTVSSHHTAAPRRPAHGTWPHRVSMDSMVAASRLPHAVRTLGLPQTVLGQPCAYTKYSDNKQDFSN